MIAESQQHDSMRACEHCVGEGESFLLVGVGGMSASMFIQGMHGPNISAGQVPLPLCSGFRVVDASYSFAL